MVLKVIAGAAGVVIIIVGVLIILGTLFGGIPIALAFCQGLDALETAIRAGRDLAEAVQTFLDQTTEETIQGLPEEHRETARTIVDIGRQILNVSGVASILGQITPLADAMLEAINSLDGFCATVKAAG